jgi:hypothetical protein
MIPTGDVQVGRTRGRVGPFESFGENGHQVRVRPRGGRRTGCRIDTKLASQPQQGFKLGAHFVEYLGRHGSDVLAPPFLPIGALDVIGQDDAVHG